jgi:hypothetical protein
MPYEKGIYIFKSGKMIKVMNFAYYMLFVFITKMLKFFNGLIYVVEYPFHSGKGRENAKVRYIENRKELDERRFLAVAFYTGFFFNIGYLIYYLDFFIILYICGIDLSNFGVYSKIEEIILFVIFLAWSWPLHNYCISKHRNKYFAEFDKFTFEENVKYSFYGILYYLAPLIILAISSYFAYHKYYGWQ